MYIVPFFLLAMYVYKIIVRHYSLAMTNYILLPIKNLLELS